jgi:predicted house-cleaning noncanonical NTP pyrophosphatase (MazG superfamily)
MKHSKKKKNNVSSNAQKSGNNTAKKHMSNREYKEELKKKKTEICRHWLESGNCYYGNRCHFAHGTDELQERTAVS